MAENVNNTDVFEQHELTPAPVDVPTPEPELTQSELTIDEQNYKLLLSISNMLLDFDDWRNALDARITEFNRKSGIKF